MYTVSLDREDTILMVLIWRMQAGILNFRSLKSQDLRLPDHRLILGDNASLQCIHMYVSTLIEMTACNDAL